MLPAVDHCLEQVLAGTGPLATCLLPSSARTAAPEIKGAYFLCCQLKIILIYILAREAAGPLVVGNGLWI